MKRAAKARGGAGRGRTVLVTGGTVRIGRAIADALAADGWRVIASSHRADSGADVIADLSRKGGADSLFAAAKALCGGEAPYAIVNNAALFAGSARKLAAVNLDAPLRLTELMAAERGGRRCVVNILDAAVLPGAETPPGRNEAYTLSKIRLAERTEDDARLYAGKVRVNAVAPGPVAAPVGVREKATATPFGRPTPGDVAAAVAYLLSAPAVTGCVIPVGAAPSSAESIPPRSAYAR